jgi:hypothetical protein
MAGFYLLAGFQNRHGAKAGRKKKEKLITKATVNFAS